MLSNKKLKKIKKHLSNINKCNLKIFPFNYILIYIQFMNKNIKIMIGSVVVLYIISVGLQLVGIKLF